MRKQEEESHAKCRSPGCVRGVAAGGSDRRAVLSSPIGSVLPRHKC
jgi:hypothetical protein